MPSTIEHPVEAHRCVPVEKMHDFRQIFWGSWFYEIVYVVRHDTQRMEMQRGRGAEGKEQGTLNSPLLPLANLHKHTLWALVRNPGLSNQTDRLLAVVTPKSPFLKEANQFAQLHDGHYDVVQLQFVRAVGSVNMNHSNRFCIKKS